GGEASREGGRGDIHWTAASPTSNRPRISAAPAAHTMKIEVGHAGSDGSFDVGAAGTADAGPDSPAASRTASRAVGREISRDSVVIADAVVSGTAALTRTIGSSQRGSASDSTGAASAPRRPSVQTRWRAEA